MLTEFEAFFIFTLTPEEALANLVAALICGLIIALLYRVTYKGISYSGTYVLSLIMLALITALVIMVIGNNLARAFGLVGAMSIIRFRTAVKDTQDIMFIFFALAAGLATGAGMYVIALTGTIFIGAVVYVASLLGSFSTVKKEYLAQLVFPSNAPPGEALQRVLKKNCSKHKIVNIKSFGEGDTMSMEYSLYIVLKNRRRALEFTNELQQLPSIKTVNVFFDEI
jgi:uncharacterized membrane protein YhiD involved in acid resistance